MRNLAALAGLALVACGGRLADDAVVADVTEDSGTATLPAPDSGACTNAQTAGKEGNVSACVFCADQNWHCGGVVFEPCPAGFNASAPCDPQVNSSPHHGCFMCGSDGVGRETACSDGGAGNVEFEYHCGP
jgi:hypothetical protein